MAHDKLYSDVPKHPVKNAVDLSEVVLPELPDSTDIRDRAKAVEGDIFEVYYRLMKSETTPPAIRKSCADALADRARGKPAQSVEIQGKITHETLIIQRAPRTIDMPVLEGKIEE